MSWFNVCKKDKADMITGKVYTSDRAGKKINFAVTMVNEMGPEKALEVAKGLKEKKIIN